MVTKNNDTIAAISTPLGEGGIGVVRLSGKNSVKIADVIFKAKDDKRLKKAKTHTAHYGHISENGSKVDEVLVTVMRRPRSYTCEDVVEISCHGGIVILKKVLDLILRKGARIAEPGEFTKRAFLNGRIDLSQAESVADIIKAKTDLGLKTALSQLNGNIAAYVEQLNHKLNNIIVEVEANIDFSDEDDIKPIKFNKISKRVKSLINEVEDAVSKGQNGKILREGATTLIVGKPNVGKSSILNALLKENRAIVTPVPGTTRDVIEEVISLDGIPFKLVDGAGIRKPRNLVEKEGVKRVKDYLEAADLIIFVLDLSRKLSKEDNKIFSIIKDKNFIVVLNKVDLQSKFSTDQVKRIFKSKKVVKTSALKGTGIGNLEKSLIDQIWKGKVTTKDPTLITNSRHIDALIRAKDNLKHAEKSLHNKMSLEFIALDLRGASDCLGEIVGRTTPEDILNQIFSQFCIGK